MENHQYFKFENLENANILLNYSIALDNMIKEAIVEEKLLDLCSNLMELYDNAKKSKLDRGTLLIIKNKKDMAIYMQVILKKVEFDEMLKNQEIQKALNSYNLDLLSDKVKFEMLKVYLINYN